MTNVARAATASEDQPAREAERRAGQRQAEQPEVGEDNHGPPPAVDLVGLLAGQRISAELLLVPLVEHAHPGATHRPRPGRLEPGSAVAVPAPQRGLRVDRPAVDVDLEVEVAADRAGVAGLADRADPLAGEDPVAAVDARPAGAGGRRSSCGARLRRGPAGSCRRAPGHSRRAAPSRHARRPAASRRRRRRRSLHGRGPPLRGAPNSPIAPRVQCGPATGKTCPRTRCRRWRPLLRPRRPRERRQSATRPSR